ncbi:hypothetical protein [Kangiella sp. HZ709]|uniref:hypothetical protein n=1 Tax=Kangiella sp. HZ709 TaxID=2666328 RepID=UPI0012AF7E22|nr:hypothetical protein [Kangiella sp. HZ709]MRX27542.1 hypothetical protein [Kangiella sp. HZ709]
MPRQKSVESPLREAFERLKNGEPSLLDQGAPITLTNVAKEAGINPASFRSDRYPELHNEVKAYSEIHRAPPSSGKKKKKRRESDVKKIKRLNKKIENLTNIVVALTTVNEQLEYENSLLKEQKILHFKE